MGQGGPAYGEGAPNPCNLSTGPGSWKPSIKAALIITLGFRWVGGVGWGHLAFQPINSMLGSESQGPVFLPGISGYTSLSQLLSLPLYLHVALDLGKMHVGACVCVNVMKGSGWLQRCLLSCEEGQVESREGCPSKVLPRTGSDPTSGISPASARVGSFRIPTAESVAWMEVGCVRLTSFF